MQIKPKVFWLAAAFLLLGAAPFYVVVGACFLVVLDGIIHAILANRQQYTVIGHGWILSFPVVMSAIFLCVLVSLSQLTKEWLPVLTRSRKQEI